ncbi:MAG: V-type ATP synthase subunit D [Candidatus Bathyarchaeota archaeon]|nr:MAG: V-type ATP synthase subunit D [Candidatus Bathyarchaeota archaeon]
MSVELTGIHPTRLELLRLRRRKKMAEGIVDILKKDLDALTVTLFEYLKQIPALRDEMRNGFAEAYDLFVEAEMLAGPRKIEEISLVSQSVDLNVNIAAEEGILGLSLPTLQLAERAASTFKPRFSLVDTPAKLDESTLKIEGALTQAIKLAEIEASMREILEAISVKKRQINRIQYKILPQLDAAIRYIGLILEETERQDAIRVRVLQRKRKERALKAD